MYLNMQVQDFLVLPATASYCDVSRYGLAKVLDFLVLTVTASYSGPTVMSPDTV